MILFLEDWSKPINQGPEGLGPIVDYQTTNKTFLDYASLLYQMGIKNWAWPLALHDPKLQGVDPMDPNLSEELKIRVGLELQENPWYYLREVALVPPVAGSDPVRFRAHRANVGMFWLFMNNVSFFLLQPRQTGKSVVADMINNYLLHYRCWNNATILVTLTHTLLQSNLERIKFMRDLLPQYTLERTANDSKAKEIYEYKARNNKLITKISQNSLANANKLGRGNTTPIQQYDEGAFIEYMDVVWPAATAATGAARDLAKERGEPYGTIITTTAGDKMSRSGRFMYDMYMNTADWTEHYFDCQDQEDLHKVIRMNSKDHDLMVGATFNHLQLGYTDEWLRGKIQALKTNDQDAINRDYFNIWTSGGRLSPLSPELNEAIQRSERDPDYIQITKNGYIVKWYIPQENIQTYMVQNHCVIGADTSEAVNRDATSFAVINVTTLETVAMVSVSEADVIKLADFLADFMSAFENTTLIIERKSTAVTFIETIYTKFSAIGLDPFKRLYNVIVQEREKWVEQFKCIADPRFKRSAQFYTQNKNKMGFNQTGNTRHMLFKEVLQLAAKYCRNIVYDKTLSNEIRGLEVDLDTGRIDHTAQNHDDNCMAWLLAMWFIFYGKNLAWYGIHSSKVMKLVTDDGTVKTDSSVREQQLIEQYQRELDEIVEKIAKNDNSIYRPVLEKEARRINNKLSFFGIETRNIDSMLQEIKEKKREKQLTRVYSPIERNIGSTMSY
nr:MAG TPA: large terminase [Caudoviricetes sp.]